RRVTTRNKNSVNPVSMNLDHPGAASGDYVAVEEMTAVGKRQLVMNGFFPSALLIMKHLRFSAYAIPVFTGFVIPSITRLQNSPVRHIQALRWASPRRRRRQSICPRKVVHEIRGVGASLSVL